MSEKGTEMDTVSGAEFGQSFTTIASCPPHRNLQLHSWPMMTSNCCDERSRDVASAVTLFGGRCARPPGLLRQRTCVATI